MISFCVFFFICEILVTHSYEKVNVNTPIFDLIRQQLHTSLQVGLHFLLCVFQPQILCKTDGGEEAKSSACRVVNGMQRKETCGTALPPRRATLPVTRGEMHPKKARRRCEAAKYAMKGPFHPLN